MFSDHNEIKFAINYRTTSRKSNIWKLNNTLLKNLLIQGKIKREIKSTLN